MIEPHISDAMFLSDDRKWPCYPLCPVKNPGRRNDRGMPVVGFVIAGKPTKVWLANMIAVFEDEVDFDSIEYKSYESIEALVNDGWIVD